MSENEKFERHHRHRSVFFPVLLIIIGAFFLLSNLNMISGSAWTLVVRFWPILFLLGAIDDLLNYKWVGAVFNIGIGGVLLLANLGYFPWTAWEMIFRLWPIFLIALGLDIVFRGESIVGSLIGVSISVVVVGALVWFALQGPLVGNEQALDISHPADSAELVEMRIQPAVAELQIDSEPNQEQVLTGTVKLAEQETLTDDYFVSNKTGHLNLSSQGTVILPSKTKKDGFLWDLSLNDEIPLKLEIEQGVGQQVLDLQDVNLQSLNSNLGVGQLTITLPDQGEFEGDLECSIGELVIRVPENMAVKFVLDTALTSVDFPSSFYREGDVIYSDQNKTEADLNTVFVEVAIGSLRIETVR
jgi:hypothetical protein